MESTKRKQRREGRKQKFENRRRALQWDGQAEPQGGGAGRWPEVREGAVWATESQASRLTGAATWAELWAGGEMRNREEMLVFLRCDALGEKKKQPRPSPRKDVTAAAETRISKK